MGKQGRIVSRKLRLNSHLIAHLTRYLVLEYIEGGELFDYLIKKGRLDEREAINYFRQIIYGVDYCHRFNICHRDLKPENLLLDKHRNIKIADFGMAALETNGRMLETSCGSPHYASPEIVAGKNYHGAPSDIWSCGIILFALLTGHLPFDDENIRRLLLKVQTGKYTMPPDLSPEAKDLIARMLQVDPAARISMKGILRHPLFRKYPLSRRAATVYQSYHRSNVTHISHPISSPDEVDQEILKNLQTLWRGEDEEKILRRLMSPEQNAERTFYYLLMKYRHDHAPLIEKKRASHQQHHSNSSSIAVPVNYHHRKKSSQTLSKKTSVKTHSRNGSRSSIIVPVSTNKRNVAFTRRKVRSDCSANETDNDDFNFEDAAQDAHSTPKRDEVASPKVPVGAVRTPTRNRNALAAPTSIAPNVPPNVAMPPPSRDSDAIHTRSIDNAAGPADVRSVSDPTPRKELVQIQKRAFSLGERPPTLDPGARPYSAYSTVSTASKSSTSSETYLLPIVFEEDRFADAVEEEVETKVYKSRNSRPGMGRLQRPAEPLFGSDDVFNDEFSANLYKSLRIPDKPESSQLQIAGLIKTESFRSTQKPAHTGFAAYRTPSEGAAAEDDKQLVKPTLKSAMKGGTTTTKQGATKMIITNRSRPAARPATGNPTRSPLTPKDMNGENAGKPDGIQKQSKGSSLLRKFTLNPRRPPPPPPGTVEIIENKLKPHKSESGDIKQNWFMKMISGPSTTMGAPAYAKRQTSQTSTVFSTSSKGSSKILFSDLGATTVRHILVEVLQEWRKYGISDIVQDKRGSAVKAVISSGNVLRMRSARFQIQVHAISGGTSLTFIQDKGSNSTFQRFLTEFERALGDMAVLAAPKLQGSQAHVVAVF